MKQINLSQGKSAIVSDEDFDMLTEYKWHLTKRGSAATKIKSKNVYMHRYICGPTDSGVVVDHIDGNKLNNTRDNLRMCSQKENSRNHSCLSKNNRSGHTGVYWGENRWVANICVDGKTIKLGRFIDINDAIFTRRVAEKKYFGEFAPKR